MRYPSLHGPLNLLQTLVLEVSRHLVLRSNHVYDVQLGQTSLLLPRHEGGRVQAQTQKLGLS